MSELLRSVPLARTPLLAKAARAVLLRALEGLALGELTLRLPDGEIRRFAGPEPGPSVTLTIVREHAFHRLATRGRMALGEAYAAGDWYADDLPAFFRFLLLNVEAKRLEPPYSTFTRVTALRPRLPSRNGLRRAKEHARYHYDLGNDLFRLMLDESMTYSCAYFESAEQSLADAQQAKYRRLCEKLRIGPDDHVLEIGCGWGGFAMHAARERGCRVTGLTISREQAVLARERIAAAGLVDRIEILERDYRTHAGSYSRIVSIEMFEAIGYAQFPVYFAACDRLLAPGGVVGLQTIAITDQHFEHYRRTNDWIQQYIFPGSLIPSVTALATAMTRSSRLMVYGLEEIGVHYARTLREWRERFQARIEEVRELGYDERFERIWDFYLAYCEAGFETRTLRDVQLVLTRPLNARLPDYPEPRVTF